MPLVLVWGGTVGKAREWWEKAASTASADAMYRLSEVYSRGLNLSPDTAKATEWHEKAEKLKSEEAKRQAQGGK